MKSRRNQAQASKSLLPVESQRTCLILPARSYIKKCKMFSSREVGERQSPCRHPLPDMHSNSRLPEGKQVFGINHKVYINSLETASHSYQLGWWEPPKIQVSRFQPRANRGSVRPAMLISSFCTNSAFIFIQIKLLSIFPAEFFLNL